jgi:hypothetical protein
MIGMNGLFFTSKPFPLSPFWVFGPSWKVEDLCWIAERSNFIFPFYSCKVIHVKHMCFLWNCVMWFVFVIHSPQLLINCIITNMSIPNSRRTHSIQSNPNQSKSIPPNCSICFTKVRSHPKPKPKSELTKYTTFFHGEANPNFWTWTSLTQVPLYANC